VTRGGVRKGAGRPPTTGEKRSATLAGVRVTPTQLAAYKDAALQANMTLTTWVTLRLDAAVLG
jgi:hypothetical protein